MGSVSWVGIVEIVIGAVLTAVGAPEIGVPLIMAGIGTTAAALLAPKPPEPVDRLDQKKRPGITGRINSPDRSIPICYGRTVVDSPPLIWGPDVKDLFTVTDEGYQTPGRIKFSAAWGVCQGPIAAFEQVTTRDGVDLQDIIKRGSVDSRYGFGVQSPIPELNRQVKYTPLAIDIDKFNASADVSAGETDNAVVLTTTQPIENFGLVFVNPQGLYGKETAESRRGNPFPKACRMRVSYKKASDPDVTNIQVTNEAVGTGNGHSRTFYLDHDAVVANSLQVKVNGFVTDSYSANLGSGTVVFSVAVGNGLSVTASYQYPVNNWKYVNHDQGSVVEYQVVRTTTSTGTTTDSVDGVASAVSGVTAPYWAWGAVAIVPIRREFEGAVVYEVHEKTYSVSTRVNSRGVRITDSQLSRDVTFTDHRPLRLPRDYYHIRIENRTQTWNADDVDAVQLIGVEEITYEDNLQYPWTAVYFLRSQSTNNLERNFLDMRFVVHGRQVVDLDAYWTDGNSERTYSDNCANVVSDVLTDPLIGLGYSLGDLDQTSFLAFYDYCEETLEYSEWKEFSFNATGDPSTLYVIPDFNASSQIDYMRVYNGTIYNPIAADDWIQTANGIKFTGAGTGGTVGEGQVPQGPRRNPAYGNVAGASHYLKPDQIKVRYRTNIKRGTVSATFDTKTSYEEAILALLEPLNSYVYLAGGKVCIAIDKDETPGTDEYPDVVLALDVQSASAVLLDGNGEAISDRMKTSIRITANPRKTKANRVRLRFLNGQNAFKDDVVVVEDPAAIATNGVQVLEKAAQTISTRRQAEEYAKSLLRKLTIDDITVQVSTLPVGQTLLPGDLVSITDSNRGWGGEVFRVTNVKLASKTQGMGAELLVVPYSDEKYTKDIVNGSAFRIRPGLSSQSTVRTGAYLTTSSARDASFQVVG